MLDQLQTNYTTTQTQINAHSLASLFTESIHRKTLPQIPRHILRNHWRHLQVLHHWGFIVGRDIGKVCIFYLMTSGPSPSPCGFAGLPSHHCNKLMDWSFPFGGLWSPATWGLEGGGVLVGVYLNVSDTRV